MSMMNTSRMVANSIPQKRELDSLDGTEQELWQGSLHTPLKANGNTNRVWRLSAGGEQLYRNSDTTFNFWLGDPADMVPIGQVILPALSPDEGLDWWLQANIYVFGIPETGDHAPDWQIIMGGQILHVRENIPWAIEGLKETYDPANDYFLSATAHVGAHDSTGAIHVNFVALESLN